MKISECAKFLIERDNFLLLTHENPDGDALGSISALYQFLKRCGKNVAAFLPEKIPANYAEFIPEGIEKSEFSLSPEDYDYIVYLDCSVEKRIANGNINLDKISCKILNIDHHPDNHLFGDMNCIENLSATAEILFRIIKWTNKSIDPELASSLMLGIVMDTGAFRFENTRSEVFKTASELLDYGADYSKIIQKMFFSKKLNYLLFESELLSQNLKIEFNGRAAVLNLRKKIMQKYSIKDRELEGLIDSIRAINSVEIAALISEKDKYIKISLRSKNTNFPVAPIARELGGGGHELAAGCAVYDNLENTEKILLEKIAETLNQ